MQSDVDRLVKAARKLAGTWPSQPPPAIPEVADVARHGKAVTPLLMADRYYAGHLLGDLKDRRGVELLVPLLDDEEVFAVSAVVARRNRRFRATGP